MAGKIRLTSSQVLMTGLTAIILAGTLLLMLPAANRSGVAIPFLDALFTATSATCVTGLVVYDTWTQFSGLGQAVILLLIQIGGLGFMTIAILFSMVLKRRIGLKERLYLMETLNALQIGGLVRLIRQILIGTALLESLGAIILATRFCPRFGFWPGIWLSVFHSVSAFCNAGFDLMGSLQPFGSLTPFAADPAVNLTVIVLIVSGGIGFVVWSDIWQKRFRFKAMNLHSRIMLSFTALLVLSSAMLFFFLEQDASMAGMKLPQRALASLFQAVTPRTAGFSTVETASLSAGGSLLTILLMLVGAGPGSTGGGIKLTTFAVILLAALASLKKRKTINIFNRSLEPDLATQAFSNAAIYILLTLTGGLVIMASQNLGFLDALFESFSAIGTVGLSTGITPTLLPLSKLVIILLMFIGRIGSLKVFLFAIEHSNGKGLRNPSEKVIIGGVS